MSRQLYHKDGGKRHEGPYSVQAEKDGTFTVRGLRGVVVATCRSEVDARFLAGAEVMAANLWIILDYHNSGGNVDHMERAVFHFWDDLEALLGELGKLKAETMAHWAKHDPEPAIRYDRIAAALAAMPIAKQEAVKHDLSRSGIDLDAMMAEWPALDML